MIARQLAARVLSALRRRLLGVSAEEIRYTFEDVRAELRATRAELKDEIAALRREIGRVEAGRGATVAAASDEEPSAEA